MSPARGQQHGEMLWAAMAADPPCAVCMLCVTPYPPRQPWEGSCCGLNRALQTDILMSQPATAANVASFGNKDFTDVIKLR